ncbi:hypothetical protein STEG23_027853 [Scotinomys teguina]
MLLRKPERAEARANMVVSVPFPNWESVNSSIYFLIKSKSGVDVQGLLSYDCADSGNGMDAPLDTKELSKPLQKQVGLDTIREERCSHEVGALDTGKDANPSLVPSTVKETRHTTGHHGVGALDL